MIVEGDGGAAVEGGAGCGAATRVESERVGDGASASSDAGIH